MLYPTKTERERKNIRNFAVRERKNISKHLDFHERRHHTRH